jgi:hypothetical protein
MSESGRTEWERQIDRLLADLLAEVAAFRRRLDDLERVVARLALGEGGGLGDGQQEQADDEQQQDRQAPDQQPVHRGESVQAAGRAALGQQPVRTDVEEQHGKEHHEQQDRQPDQP